MDKQQEVSKTVPANTTQNNNNTSRLVGSNNAGNVAGNNVGTVQTQPQKGSGKVNKGLIAALIAVSLFCVFLVILVVVLIIGGAFLGFKLKGKNNNTVADSTTESMFNGLFGKKDKEETISGKTSTTELTASTGTTESRTTEQITTEAGTTAVTTTEARTTAATTEATTETIIEDNAYTPPAENLFIQGVFLSSDPNLSGGSESRMEFYPNGYFTMDINFGEGFCSYDGYYTTSTRQYEMDDVYVYMTFNQTTNGIPKNATVVFSDTPDYCEFLTDGFGLLGYGDPPYGFSRLY